MRVFTISADPDLRTIRVRESGRPGWTEFRSDLAYPDWGEDPSPAQRLHDALEGWHACVLHAGGEVAILPRHPDWTRVRDLLAQT